MAHNATPPETGTETRAAPGCPRCAGATLFGAVAETLLDNGYEPLPIKPGTKVPALPRWTTVKIDASTVEDWCRRYPDHGVGIRTGSVVGVDIDVTDSCLAHELQALAEARFGATLMRIGRWPKRLLLYRAATPQLKMCIGKVEIHGLGQQFVAFGIHPDTGRPYDWPLGDTPLDVPLGDLPLVDAEACSGFLAKARALLPGEPPPVGRSRGTPQATTTGPIRGDGGLVIDGRDSWLSTIAFHAVHDAWDAPRSLTGD